MVFTSQKISNYGSSTPAVARTFLQGSKILEFFSTTKKQREDAKAVLYELQRQLLRCVEIRDRISREVKAGHEKGLQIQSAGRVVQLPNVADLQSCAEAFLQAAKLAIRETARLVKPFYGVSHDHRFQKFASWAERKFGATDSFAQALRKWEPWVKHIIDMRNAVDHPSGEPGGKLLTENFKLSGSPEHLSLVDPTWCLSGSPKKPILPDMESIIEGIIELGEEIIAALFQKLKHDFPLVLYEIPVEQRDPSCPIRLRVGWAPKS